MKRATKNNGYRTRLYKIFTATAVLLLLLVAAKPKPVKVFLVGDSTMADKAPIDETPERGWGMVFPSFFNDNVIIENHARNGRSTKTFISEGRWDFLINRVGKGDYVIIQFGHNDEVSTKKAYATPEEFDKNLRKMVIDVKTKGASPVLCTSIARRKFDSIGNTVDTHPVYPEIMKKVASELNVPLIDMKAESDKVLKKYGVEASAKLFMNIEPGIWKAVPEGKKDDTHLVDAGAMEMAALAANGIRQLRIKPLNKYLVKPSQIKMKYTIPVEGIESVKPQ